MKLRGKGRPARPYCPWCRILRKARADSETWDLGLATNEGSAKRIRLSLSGLCSGRPTKLAKLCFL
ncbi:hypothetical protein IEQ34_025091 [Dendrobium chrysotoxum]|uniref:Uncharacterized protein n=1 Tax=Dendrobium chrysotoxum TaxID=161865 RepID=A0AAV7FQT7_DENCH|nr:hypothetical protein IEQ34_025091 [Dendrobium chrysotoxum]